MSAWEQGGRGFQQSEEPRNRYQAIAAQGRPCHQWDNFSLRHPPMNRTNRAKQFQPYDALKGYRDAVREKESQLVPQRELSEEERAAVNGVLFRLAELCGNSRLARRNAVRVRVQYFEEVPVSDEDLLLGADPDVSRGFYRDVSGIVTKMDTLERSLHIGKTAVSFELIARIDAELPAPDSE